MSAAELIEQFKALPKDEQAKVVEFVRELPSEGPSEEVKAAGEWVIENYPDLLRKLAQ